MPNAIILGLTTVTAFLVVVTFVRQIVAGASQNNANRRLEELLNQLAKEQKENEQTLRESLMEKLSQSRLEQSQQQGALKEELQESFAKHRARFDERQMETLKILQEVLNKGVNDNRQQLKEALFDHSKELSRRIDLLTQTTEAKLKEINGQVEKRLAEGLAKTNETFTDIIKRLALIDEAQKKITELSTNVVSLQDLLNDKRSRGAFGEVQLSSLIRNVLPEKHFAFQHQLSNGKRADCILFLPKPTGDIAIDAKFPLESYKIMLDDGSNELDRQQAQRQFKQDIKKHIQDIAAKYIIPGETADGALMFIPAEAVFAEIHAHHPDLVELAQTSHVWMVSPTTMMAILTTSRAVLKDAATREQVHEIQQHIKMLSTDFSRFQLRMDNLAKRIKQAHEDVDQVHISSRKITQRFGQIEKADLDELNIDEDTKEIEAAV